MSFSIRKGPGRMAHAAHRPARTRRAPAHLCPFLLVSLLPVADGSPRVVRKFMGGSGRRQALTEMKQGTAENRPRACEGEGRL